MLAHQQTINIEDESQLHGHLCGRLLVGFLGISEALYKLYPHSIKYAFIVQRIDNGKTYGVKLKSGVKPIAIDSSSNLANKGELAACEIDSLRLLENKFS